MSGGALTRRSLAMALAAVVLGLGAGQPEWARADEAKTLRQEIDALKESQEALRRELEEIKSLLLDRRETTSAPRKGQTMAVRVADAPFRGSATAKVTVVEFSDYRSSLAFKSTPCHVAYGAVWRVLIGKARGRGARVRAPRRLAGC